MSELLLWLFTAQVVGLAAFPLVFRAFPRLAERGWGLAIPAGMLMSGTVMWLLSYVHILPNTTWAWWLTVVAIAIGGYFAVRNHQSEFTRLFRTRWHGIVGAQVMFLVFFLLFALLRANDPNITNTEKPMEIMMLNSAVSAEYAPPEDAWLAGESVAYYYGGYWMLGGIAKLSGVSTAYGFNLSLALLAGLAASAVFSVVYSMVSRDGGGLKEAVLSGTVSGVLLLLLASLTAWWELAANIGVGTDQFYRWLSIDGLKQGSAAGRWHPTSLNWWFSSTGLMHAIGDSLDQIIPEKFWWWFRASRVINTFDANGIGQDFTIEEFPAFSFILGDLHPHVISMPFVLLGIATAYNLFTSPERWDWKWLRRNPFSAVAIGLIFGTAGFINQAEIILMSALFGGVVTINTYGESGKKMAASAMQALPVLATLAVAGVVVFSPFYFGTLGGQIQSPPIAPAVFGTRPVHFLTVWGLFMLAISPFVLHFAWPTAARYWGAVQRVSVAKLAAARLAEDDARPWRSDEVEARLEADVKLLRRLDRSTWIVPLALTVVPYFVWAVTHIIFSDLAQAGDIITRLGTVLPLGTVFVALFFVLVRKAHSGWAPASLFALLLATLTVYMLFGAELFFVNDLFGNRMNTVFKFYFQSWMVLSVIAGYGLFYWARAHREFSGRRLLVSRTAAVVLAVLVIGPLWWTLAAAQSKTGDYTGPVTLDGWAFLGSSSPGDAAVISFLQENAHAADRIVEAVGGGYTENGRIAAATGLPTVIGWPGHERQWRGTDELFSNREDDVRTIYESTDVAETRRLLDLYEVKYVVIGNRERSGYPTLRTSKFDSLGEKVFESDGAIIYMVRGQAS
jgi:YYY domain-containing protein